MQNVVVQSALRAFYYQEKEAMQNQLVRRWSFPSPSLQMNAMGEECKSASPAAPLNRPVSSV